MFCTPPPLVTVDGAQCVVEKPLFPRLPNDLADIILGFSCYQPSSSLVRRLPQLACYYRNMAALRVISKTWRAYLDARGFCPNMNVLTSRNIRNPYVGQHALRIRLLVKVQQQRSATATEDEEGSCLTEKRLMAEFQCGQFVPPTMDVSAQWSVTVRQTCNLQAILTRFISTAFDITRLQENMDRGYMYQTSTCIRKIFHNHQEVADIARIEDELHDAVESIFKRNADARDRTVRDAPFPFAIFDVPLSYETIPDTLGFGIGSLQVRLYYQTAAIPHSHVSQYADIGRWFRADGTPPQNACALPLAVLLIRYNWLHPVANVEMTSKAAVSANRGLILQTIPLKKDDAAAAAVKSNQTFAVPLEPYPQLRCGNLNTPHLVVPHKLYHDQNRQAVCDTIQAFFFAVPAYKPNPLIATWE